MCKKSGMATVGHAWRLFLRFGWRRVLDATSGASCEHRTGRRRKYALALYCAALDVM